MEELLRYALFEMALKILLFELVIIGFCLITILLLKAHYEVKQRRSLSCQSELSSLIMGALSEKNLELKVPIRLRGFKDFLLTLVSFDRRINDQGWHELKLYLIKKYLLKRSHRLASSFIWTNRYLAAQCFALTPKLAEKKVLKKLLHDTKLLVRAAAAESICKLDSEELFYQVIDQVSKETSLSRSSFRDILINTDTQKFQWLQQLLKKKPEAKIAAVCLDIFATRTSQNLFPVIVPYIYGKDQELRLLAIKILKNIPSGEATDILTHCLKDDQWQIRAEALKSLDPTQANHLFEYVQSLLNDAVWEVRLQAALLLKLLGEKGVRALSLPRPDKEPKAYEISRYILALPEKQTLVTR